MISNRWVWDWVMGERELRKTSAQTLQAHAVMPQGLKMHNHLMKI
jgi:hypothetical protein